MKSVIASALAMVAISQPLFATNSYAAENIADLEKAARGEGQLHSIGMPDSWANWKDTWQQLGSIYGIKHQDTDMSSAQEIAKFAAEKANATADIGDVGGAFGPVAVKQGV
ncbi:MAG: ABC transporter substrate-binding protein, partial [Aeromonas veronii]